MPELPEVERARKLIQDSCKGYKIASVTVTEDKIVYTGGINHNEFAKELTGRTILGCSRKGKNFWLDLSGEGRTPVMHFGMTGMLQLQGEEPTWYRRRPKERTKDWPPRFHKFVLDLEPQPGSVSDEPRALAFMDGRRLGRIRLLSEPVLDQKPLSALGFDPLLSYPSLEEFKKLIEKKKGTVKGMIMDQAFSAGVGNWVADEILYQARIHPSCPVPLLSEQNIIDLHHQIRAIPERAVAVNADHKQFPEDWLFRWRWSKGKKQDNARKKVEEDEELGGEDIKPKGKAFLALPSGKPATIEFIEVSGRTTAVVTEIQKMPEGVEIKPKITKGGKGSQKRKDQDGSDDQDPASPGDGSIGSETEKIETKVTTPRQKAAAAMKVKEELDVDSTTPLKDAALKERRTSGKRKSSVKVEEVKVEIETPPKKPRKSVSRPSASTKRSKRKSRNGIASAESSDLSDAPE